MASVRIENEGEEAGRHCSGRVDVDLIEDGKAIPLFRDETLNWSQFDPAPAANTVIQFVMGHMDYVMSAKMGWEWASDTGRKIQESYCTKRDSDLISRKPEFLEICFTLSGDFATKNEHAYLALCSKKGTLDFGKVYRVKIQLVGDGLTEKPKYYQLDCNAWDSLTLTEVPSP